jgi:dynactin complex subunit
MWDIANANVNISFSLFTVGKNDGSVDGQRYFQTDSQRGIFVREDDLVVLGSPPVSQ